VLAGELWNKAGGRKKFEAVAEGSNDHPVPVQCKDQLPSGRVITMSNISKIVSLLFLSAFLFTVGCGEEESPGEGEQIQEEKPQH
jgi:hypothetical protein